ncbi:MAG: RHS repeat-associated core domain-containing protein, partial [Pirellulaceae bacterium]
PLGRVTDYTYDAAGRLTRVRRAVGTPLQVQRQYEYDAAGNLTAMTDELGRRTDYQYDALNRLVRITEPDPDGTGPLASPETQYTYDAVGNLIAVVDPLGHRTQWTFDMLDRLVQETDSLQHATSYTYDQAGNIIRAVDPLGRTTQFQYDVRNRQIAVTDPAGNTSRLVYDVDDNPIQTIDELGNITQFVFDARNRVSSRIDALGNVETFAYDPNDNLLERTDRLGRTTRYEYDPLNRPVREEWLAEDQSIINTIHTAYDLASNLVSVQDGTGTIEFTWDARDQSTSIRSSGARGLPASELTYTFDAAGNLLTASDMIQGVAGGTNAYVYDALDRVTRVTQSGPTVAPKRADFEYDAVSHFAAIQRYADLAATQLVASTAFTYDGAHRLTSLIHRDPGQAVLNSFSYAFDGADRITRMTDGDGVTDYVYDRRDQLTQAQHSDEALVDEIYGYDAAGNRTSSHQPGADYEIGDGMAGTPDANRLTSDGIYLYEYDRAGSLTRRITDATGEIREFAYDHRQRLVRVVDRAGQGSAPTQTVEFLYDALNRRVGRFTDLDGDGPAPERRSYLVHSGDAVLAEWVDPDGDGPAPLAEDHRYLHGPALDQVLAQEDASGQVLWTMTDHLGTVRDVVDGQGDVVNHLQYDSFGKVVSETDPAVDVVYQFTGREWDAATGLLYLRARYYDPAIGRFTQEDPLGMAGGDVNLYRYAGNRPIEYADPLGMTASPPPANTPQGSQKLTPGWQFVHDVKESAKHTAQGVVNFGRAAADLARTVANWKQRMNDAANSDPLQQAEKVQKSKKETVKAAKICAVGAKKTVNVGNPGGLFASALSFVGGKIYKPRGNTAPAAPRPSASARPAPRPPAPPTKPYVHPKVVSPEEWLRRYEAEKRARGY